MGRAVFVLCVCAALLFAADNLLHCPVLALAYAISAAHARLHANAGNSGAHASTFRSRDAVAVRPTSYAFSRFALPTSRDCALGGKALGVLPLLPLPTVMSLSPIELASLWKQRDEIFMCRALWSLQGVGMN